MTLNLDNYEYLKENSVLDFFDIDFGHLFWFIGNKVWKVAFVKWKRAIVYFQNLEYKDLKHLALGLCLVVCCCAFSVYCALVYLALIDRRKTGYFSYGEYKNGE